MGMIEIGGSKGPILWQFSHLTKLTAGGDSCIRERGGNEI